MQLSFFKTRVGRFLLSLGLVLLAARTQASVVISEFMYHAIGGNAYEFIELHNPGPGSINLKGYAFTDGIAYTFADELLLAEGDYVVVVQDRAAFQGRYPDVTQRAPGVYTGKLKDEGEVLTLLGPQSNQVFSVDYDNRDPWPETAAGFGSSLVLRDPQGGVEVGNWAASLEFQGSPGRAGNFASRRILINEVLTHTDPPLEDAIELYNPGTNDVDISGWFLSDQNTARKKFRIPEGSIVPAGEYAVLYEGAFNDATNLTNIAFALSSSLGDEVYLTSADTNGNLLASEDFVAFEAAANGVSFGRYPDGVGPLRTLSTHSFGIDSPNNPEEFRTGTGVSNHPPLVGPVVINEIMYRPPELDGLDNELDEYLELVNISGTALPLFNPAHPTNTWLLTNAVDFVFPTGVTLAADEIILITNDEPEAFRVRNAIAPGIRIFGPWSGKLDNSSDSLRLYRPDHPANGFAPLIAIDRVDYRDSFPWPAGPDGGGVSLEKNARDLLGDEASHWHDSAQGGTPGQLNSPHIPGGRIIISEILAHNETILTDEDGDFEDVIELYNRSNAVIDLTSWYLTDLRDQLTKWAFPAKSIAAGARLTVFASGKNRSTAGGFNLHTNFQLDSDGEYLGLVRANGVTIEFELDDFPAVPPDVSVGYVETNLNAGVVYFHEATLGGSNSSPGFESLVPAPQILPLHGTTGSTVNVSIVAPEDATVHYTLDGTEPTELSPTYTVGFTVTTPITVRARAVRPGQHASILTSRTYLPTFLGINELMARNMSSYADILDFTDFDDWIELHHAGTNALDIGGYHLSDDPDHRFKYRIPDGTRIPANGFLLLWADGYHDQGVYLHTNFKLGSEGETLALYDAYGGLLDELTFGPQVIDVSIGRKPDGADDLVFFGEPTPLAANSTEGLVNNIASSEAPTFDPPAGFYPTNLFVALQAPGADIHYTVNGDLPTRNDPLYTSPIEIRRTTTLRARAYEPGNIPSAVRTASYILGQADHGLPIVAITADQEHLMGESKGIFTNRIKGKEIPMHLEWWEGVSEPRALSFDAGMRMFGFTFYPQRPFSIAMRDKYGMEALGYPLFDDRRIEAFERFILRSSGDDWPNAFYKDALTHELIGDLMENGTQAYRPVISYLNGEPYGILNLREKLDEHWIRDNYGYELDQIDYWEYEFDLGFAIVSAGDGESYDTLIRNLKFWDIADPVSYASLASRIDIDDFMNWAMLECYVGNSGWFHNRKWWKPRTPTGKWRWMIFDLDRGYESAEINVFQDMITRFHFWEFRKLMTNPDFKHRFTQRASAQLSNVYSPTHVHQTQDRVIERITPAMSDHRALWAPEGARDMASWIAFNGALHNLATNRNTIVRDQIRTRLGLGDDCIVSLLPSGSGSGQIMANYVVLNPALGEQILFRDIPVALRVVPDIGSALVHWSIQDGSAAAVMHTNSVANLSPTNDLIVQTVFELSGESLIPPAITNDFTLTAAGSPWLARGDWVIHSNVTCTVEAGVEILMPDQASILVHGELLVNGTAAAPVVIQSNPALNARRPIYRDPTVHDPAEIDPRWGSLFFEHATHTGRLNHLHIFKASEGRDAVNGKGAISSLHSNLELEHVRVEQVHFPVFVQYGSFSMKDSRLHTDVTSDLVNVKHASFALIENCDLEGNHAIDTDAIDYDNIDGGLIRSNRIYGFRGFNSDGIDIGEGAQDIQIVGNHIYDIRDKGISIGQGS
ncbi:MAG: hypothetical protein ACI9QL_001873, partial [Candidatus Omnitrophota bacterium]